MLSLVTPGAARARIVLAIACLGALGACAHRPFARVPGDTDIRVARVVVEQANGDKLTVDPAEVQTELIEKLGLRAGSPIMPARKYNVFRLREDRHRIATFYQLRGYFDVQVAEPEVSYSEESDTASVVWKVEEGRRYKLTGVFLEGVPAPHLDEMRAAIPFAAGDPVQLDNFRPVRRALAERLQDHGYGHARVYTRLYVSRRESTCDWYFIADPGPMTRVGTIAIEGARHVPEAMVRARLGLRPGGRHGPTATRLAERDLLDTGAYSSVNILDDADIDKGLPEFPTTGGAVPPERLADDGSLLPRDLPETVNLRVRVVESPSRQARFELGVEADPWRLDGYASTRVWLRHLLGPLRHLVIEGSAGHGTGFRDDELDGFYGHGLVRYIHASAFARVVDIRVSARYRDTLLPTARMRQLQAGPGARASIGTDLFLDLDLVYRHDQDIDFGPFDDAERARLALWSDDTWSGAELSASLIADRRDDRIEPRAGYLWSVRARVAPGGPLSDTRYLELAPEVRVFRPLGPAWGVAARAGGAVVLGHGDQVPLAVRSFGGGPFGMRGFGRQRLAPETCVPAAAAGDPCARELVGGLGLFEASLEARYLPYRGIVGFAGFVDLGAASADENPFADGVSLALGAGVRARLWYVPISIDMAYRLVDQNALVGPISWRPYQVFVRMGEAF